MTLKTEAIEDYTEDYGGEEYDDEDIPDEEIEGGEPDEDWGGLD